MNHPPPLPANPEQQAVLNRILAQRERLRAHRAYQKNHPSAPTDATIARVPLGDTLGERLLAFAKLHPLFTATIAALAVAAGPVRLRRWVGMLLPWIVSK